MVSSKRVFGDLGWFRQSCGTFAGSRLRDCCYDDSPQLFRKPFGANPSVFLPSGESSFGDLYIEGHGVGPAAVLDDELVLPVLLRRDLNRTLRSGRVVLTDSPARRAQAYT